MTQKGQACFSGAIDRSTGVSSAVQGGFSHRARSNRIGDPPQRLVWLLLVLAGVGAFLVLAELTKYAYYGIDFTDEGFYLAWISDPYLYDWSTTQFGYVYHPLYRLLGGNVAFLRLANVYITFGLSWALVDRCLSSLMLPPPPSRLVISVIAGGLATISLLEFQTFLLTPSYNSLALQSLLVAAIGLLLAEKQVTPGSLSGWILVGVGGWLAFMAKPTTAMALVAGALVYLLVAKKLSIKLLCLSAASALLLLMASCLWIDGSVGKFIERLKVGMTFAQYLAGGHSLSDVFRIDSVKIGSRSGLAIIVLALITSAACASLFHRRGRITVIISNATCFLCFALIASFSLGIIHHSINIGDYQGIVTMGVVIPLVTLAFLLNRGGVFASIHRERWAFALVCFLFPYIYAFGTNNNYWLTGVVASIFLVLGGVALVSASIQSCQGWIRLAPLVVVAEMMVSALLQTGIAHPYRQPAPLWTNSVKVTIGSLNSDLVLSHDYAKYITDARQVAQDAMMPPGTPVIDLTAESPTLIYALGARNLGRPWMIGGYPGSARAAEAALARSPCSLIAKAWVLTEPDGPRPIPYAAMDSFSPKFPDGYEEVGHWETARGAGGNARSYTQTLFKPTSAKSVSVMQACVELHASVHQ